MMIRGTSPFKISLPSPPTKPHASLPPAPTFPLHRHLRSQARRAKPYVHEHQTMSSHYSIGIATGDVTPPIGGALSGFSRGGYHSSTGVYHPLRVVVMALDDGATPLLIVSIEWLGFYHLTPRIRERLAADTGIPASQIILTATHTHCGPMLRKDHERLHGSIDHDYLDRAIETIAATAGKAWRYRQPADIYVGTGHCSLAMNRRFPDPLHPGLIQRRMAPNPDGAVDHEVCVMVIESENLPRGLLFSYTCHPTSRGGLLFGGDYVGFAYDEIQEAFQDVQPCFLQGCAGDIKPRPVAPEHDDFGLRTVKEVAALGQELGEAVIRVVRDGGLRLVTGPLDVCQSILPLQTEPLERRLLEATLLDPEASDVKREWARHHHARLQRGEAEEQTVPFEIQTVRFGESLAMIGMAAEMTVEHGLRLKRELKPHFKAVLPIAYTNDIIGYIPVKRQFSELGYEVSDANLARLRTGRFLPETEDQIHAAIHSMLKVAP